MKEDMWKLVPGNTRYIHKITGTIYDQDGFDYDGYDRNGFNREGIHRDTGLNVDSKGYGKDGFNRYGHNRDGFGRDGIHIYTHSKYDRDGCDINGWKRDGTHRDTNSKYGLDGFTKNGFSRPKKEYGGKRIHKITGTIYDEDGFDYDGYDKDGFNRDGFNRDGYDRNGYDREGFNTDGINRDKKTREDVEQEKENTKEEHKQQTRKNYLGLIDKANRLAAGQMSIEEYIMKSKTSILDLIAFAKKEHLSADTIRGLYRFISPYKTYRRPFNKKEYLSSTTLIIDGEKVKPTEQDVDICIEYLNANGSLVCDKTVRDTVRGYLKGEIDITQRSQVPEEDTKTQLEALEEEQEELKNSLEKVEQLENEVVQAEKKNQSKKIGE